MLASEGAIRSLLVNACMLPPQAKHSSGNESTWGINGETGQLVDMNEYNIWEPFAVKIQTIKTAIEVWVTSHAEPAESWRL